jgi:hypothetical protein
LLKLQRKARSWWFISVLASWEAEIGRIKVQGQPWENSLRDAISKITREK